MTIQIPLSTRNGSKYKGLFFAVVDDEDAEFLLKYRWSVLPIKNSDLRYAYRNVNKKLILLHRVIAELMFGEIPEGYEVDHVDGNGLNCTRENLRLVTHAQNGANRGLNSNNTSGYQGVIKRKNNWVAYLTINKKRIHLGTFKTFEEAKTARMNAELLHFGEYARK